jgi:hypothetical protein
MEAFRDSKEMREAVTEINKFSNLLGYQQGLKDRWKLRADGRDVTGAQYYDLEAQAKLDETSNSFEDVEFVVLARVVALEEILVRDLPGRWMWPCGVLRGKQVVVLLMVLRVQVKFMPPETMLRLMEP